MRAHMLLPVLLILLITLFNAQMWLGSATIPKIFLVNHAISQQQAVVKQMQERNNHLFEQIKSLKGGKEELEARARLELGMVKPGETFYELPAAVAPVTSSAMMQ